MATSNTVVDRRQRQQWADNLRVIVIAAVIVGHTATAYFDIGVGFFYDDEHSTSQLWATILAFPGFAGAFFALAPLFVIAGWFSVRSMAHRGPAGFLRTRLLRLGLPLLTFVLLIEPIADYVGNLWDERRSLASYLALDDIGVAQMWFVAALLAFSMVYAALRALHPAMVSRRHRSPAMAVAITAGTIIVTSIAVWQVWPWNTPTYIDLRLGGWQQGAALFAFGVYWAGTGRLQDLPRSMARRLGWIALASTILMIALFAFEVARGEPEAILESGTGWPTVAFAVLYGVISVAWSLWFVTWLRERWPTHGPLLDKAGRGSYATYVMHPLVLTVVMVLFASAPLAPELKFLVVSAAGVPVCFLVGYAITRLPGISKVL